MKKILRLVILPVYLTALLLSLVIAVKPGAAIFYLKITLEPQAFQPDAGYAYRYQVKLPPAFFPPEKALIFEDGQQLPRALSSEVIQTGNGAFVTDTSDEGGFYYVYLAPKDNSDPTTDGKTYRLYSAVSFLSQTMGILYFSTLLFGAYHFARFAFSPPQRLKLRQLDGVLQISDAFLMHLKAAAGRVQSQTQTAWRSRLADGARLWIFTASAAYGLIFMEWLFQVTKSSFMDDMSLGRKVEIFLLSGLALAAASLALNAVLLLAEYLLRPLRLAWLAACAAAAIPALLFTSLAVLWGDSFLYTVFRFGILTSSGLLRTVFGMIIMLFLFGSYFWLLRLWGLTGSARMAPTTFKLLSGVVLGLVAVSAVLAGLRVDFELLKTSLEVHPMPAIEEKPNIILIGSDGVNAKNMSAYGYSRDTTPRIKELAEVSLVAENAFTNSGTTHGSVNTILTGKRPTRTRVIYPPDILLGVDSYQHFPGILKDLGYTSSQIGVIYYVDAHAANMQNGFDFVNQHSIKEDVLVQTLRRLGFDYPAYFTLAIEERLINRLYQALYVDTIANPFTTVTNAASWLDDRKRMNDLLGFLEDAEPPLFAHVHLMVTHGDKFSPAQRIFSAEQTQEQEWMTDFYDDSILTFDQYIGELVDALKASGEFDNTILIIYSDHAMRWQFNERIPLLIHFPNDEYKGRLQYNVQNLDIAPTLLDYLGIPIPEWMEGDSLLQPGLEEREVLFSVSTNAHLINFDVPDASERDPQQFESLYYDFSVIQAINCQRWYRLDLINFEWTSGEIDQHTAPCAEEDLLDMAQIKQAVLQHLTEQGLGTSAIP